MTRSKQRAIAMVLAVLTMFSVFAVGASAATWRTGNFGGGYTTVYLEKEKDKKDKNKEGEAKTGYIKIHTYECRKVESNHTGKCKWSKETSTKLHITLRDTSGNWLCEFDTTSGIKLKLGNDHDAYRVYISRPNFYGAIGVIDGIDNAKKSSHWAIQCVKNTYM